MTEKRLTKEKKGRSHGTPGRYAEGCKCGPCTDRNTERNRIAREKRIAGGIPADVVHGASTFRNWDCHCPVCVQGNRDMLTDRNHAAGPGVNRRKEWTSEELQVVSARQPDGRRYTQTAYEVAVALGRSVSAVNKQRSVVRVNPEKINVAAGGN